MGHNLPFEIMIGEWDTSIPNAYRFISQISKFIVHEDYNIVSDFDADLALLKTTHPIPYNVYVQPICPPPPHEGLLIGEMVTVSGWGLMKPGDVLCLIHGLRI